MNKIPTVFERDWDGDRSRVLPQVVPGCEWVAEGEGVATRKYDGTCCLVRDGKLYRRHEVREGKPTPDGFEQVEHDEATGKLIGWVPVGDDPADKWHREAIPSPATLPDGTYELCGPKVQRNPEGYEHHLLIPHDHDHPQGALVLPEAPRTFDDLAHFLAVAGIEGIVWHHPDGRMAKVKARDFGLKRA